MNSRDKNISTDYSDVWGKIRNGDQNALGDVFHKYYNELFYYGIKISPDPETVKDTIQNLFIAIAESGKSLGNVKNVKGYLIVSLRRRLLKKKKKKLIFFSLEVAKETKFVFSPEDFTISNETSTNLSNQLAICFDQLSARQREVIMLRFYHGLRMDEAAKVLGMSVQASRNLLFRALKKIRKVIPDDIMKDYADVKFFLFAIFSRQ